MPIFSSPLQDFLKFCHQFKFSVIKDPDFPEIESIASDLASEHVLGFDVEQSMSFLDWLTKVLFVEMSHVSSKSLSILQECRLPCIELLGALSSWSNIWIFVWEMHWFGDDSLKKFYKEWVWEC